MRCKKVLTGRQGAGSLGGCDPACPTHLEQRHRTPDPQPASAYWHLRHKTSGLYLPTFIPLRVRQGPRRTHVPKMPTTGSETPAPSQDVALPTLQRVFYLGVSSSTQLMFSVNNRSPSTNLAQQPQPLFWIGVGRRSEETFTSTQGSFSPVSWELCSQASPCTSSNPHAVTG